MLTQGELHALRSAAEQAWDDDTRHEAYRGHPLRSAGQCYSTSRWLADRLGGHVARKGGHYFYVDANEKHAVDLTGDQFPSPPLDPRLERLTTDEDEGLEFESHHKTWRSGPIVYKKTDHPHFAGYEIVPPVHDEHASRFAHRANRIFDDPERLKRTADMIGDAYPAETPQAVADMDQRYFHHEPGQEPESQEYKFVYANGRLEVSPTHGHEELAGHAGINPDHTGPVAMGSVIVANGSARFETTGNIGARALNRVLNDYCKHVGWKWGGLTDTDGWPISDEFAGKKSSRLYFSWAEGHLNLSPAFNRVASGTPRIIGYLDIDETEKRVSVVPTKLPRYFESLRVVAKTDMSDLGAAVFEWASDQGFVLMAGDNVVKTIEDLQEHNLYDPNPTQPNDHQYPATFTDERQPGGVYRCPQCQIIYPTWNAYQLHRQSEEPMGDSIEDGGFPEADPGPFGDGAHYTEMRQEPGITTGRVHMATVKQAQRIPGFQGHQEGDEYAVAYSYGCAIGYARLREGHVNEIRTVDPRCENALLDKLVRVADKKPRDLVEGPIPFIFDVQEDTLDMGQPNTRMSDIPGRFTPGGIVEGVYEPGGKVFIRTVTNMPYTVRHLLELWYVHNPMLEVTAVHLRDDAGKDTKLASVDIGGYIAAMVAADPTAAASSRALQQAGGRVFAVGGAVRDALMGKEPKDIDLMVTGLEPNAVNATLEGLPGRVDLTGKDFGVFRYRNGGDDVEIALPRRERSTGEGHQDFDVQADHTMKPEEDLYRRDFTANAMAVDLSNGHLIDPFGGAQDIEQGKLSTLNDTSLSEDPLRVVRALVAHGKHGLDPDENTKGQMRTSAGSLQHLPAERIQAELDKLFAAKDPASAIRLARDTGVLPYILPEVDDAFGFDQNNPHHELELGEHLLSVLHRAAQVSKDPDVRLAALLHDIGKPASAWQDPDPEKGFHYYHNRDLGLGQDHERVGADMARERMTALKYPNDRIDRVAGLVRHHMYAPFTTPKGARKFLNKVGDHADDLMNLRWADQGGKSEYPVGDFSLDQERELVDQVRSAGEATDQSSLAINGHDLIQDGHKPGPQMGTILKALTDAVIEEPSLNNREQLLELARSFA